jgi:large subunit ribosomal protein L25
MDRTKLEVRPREGRGGKDARALRANGEVPGVVYGAKTAGKDSIAVRVNIRALRQAVSGPGGLHSMLDLKIDGERSARSVIIKDLQLDPVKDRVLHVDFNEVRLDQPIQTPVAVHLTGTPHGVTIGGVLSQPVHELTITALPGDIPDEITVDVSGLDIGTSLRLADIAAPAGVTFNDDPEGTVIASVTAPTVEPEPEEVEEEAEEGAEEGEEGAAAEGEGEEAAAPEESGTD